MVVRLLPLSRYSRCSCLLRVSFHSGHACRYFDHAAIFDDVGRYLHPAPNEALARRWDTRAFLDAMDAARVAPAAQANTWKHRLRVTAMLATVGAVRSGHYELHTVDGASPTAGAADGGGGGARRVALAFPPPKLIRYDERHEFPCVPRARGQDSTEVEVKEADCVEEAQLLARQGLKVSLACLLFALVV